MLVQFTKDGKKHYQFVNTLKIDPEKDVEIIVSTKISDRKLNKLLIWFVRDRKGPEFTYPPPGGVPDLEVSKKSTIKSIFWIIDIIIGAAVVAYVIWYFLVSP